MRAPSSADALADGQEMPEYQCHKHVWALQIDYVAPDGTIHFVDPSFAPHFPERHPGIFARGTAAPGDYLVKYDDDYWSWSPRWAFENGYKKL
jgi:hypothetical protein